MELWRRIDDAEARYGAALGELPDELQPRPDIAPYKLSPEALRASRVEFSNQVSHIGSVGLGLGRLPKASRETPPRQD